MSSISTRRPLIAAGVLLGTGMGGFIDGIVFHQLLQVHSMLSARVTRDTLVGLQINMFWDGVFHTLTWTMTALGLALLWKTAQPGGVPLSSRTFAGSLTLGWGLFNLVEGVINHHLLHLHHVTETENHLVWDLVFLGSGLTLTVVGAGMLRESGEDRLG